MKHGKLAPEWKPGESGNPGGRPKQLVNVTALAREHTEKAIQTLVELMEGKYKALRKRALELRLRY